MPQDMQDSGITVRDNSHHHSSVRLERLEWRSEVLDLGIYCSVVVEVKSAEERISVRVKNVALVIREDLEERSY